MNEIYWLTRLDTLETIFKVVTIISACIIAFNYLSYDEDERKKYKKTIKTSFIAFVVSLLLNTFVPNTKEATMIWGVGGTIDYIKSNDTAKQLPDKCIQALDKFVDEYMLNEENDKEK